MKKSLGAGIALLLGLFSASVALAGNGHHRPFRPHYVSRPLVVYAPVPVYRPAPVYLVPPPTYYAPLPVYYSPVPTRIGHPPVHVSGSITVEWNSGRHRR